MTTPIETNTALDNLILRLRDQATDLRIQENLGPYADNTDQAIVFLEELKALRAIGLQGDLGRCDGGDMSLTRRNFLNNLLVTGAAFAILPGAGRVWRAERVAPFNSADYVCEIGVFRLPWPLWEQLIRQPPQIG